MSEVDNSTYNNDFYKRTIGASRIRQACWYFVNILFFVNPVNVSGKLKIWLLRRFGAKIGEGVVIKPSVNIKYPWKLIIDDNAWVGENVWIDNLADVSIGKSSCISQGAMLLTGNHNYKRRSFDLMVSPIVLHEGVWIGARALVGPGVIAGSHAVLSAMSVATKNLSPYKIYQGNPAVPVRERIIDDL
jgi:putative colanic acid biosynthesis acetyltransferase WcaF